MKIVRVALDIPLPRLFDYACAESLALAPGARIVVPFGKRRLVGVVVELAGRSEVDPAKMKTVESVLDDAPVLPGDWVVLMKFLSSYYQRPLGETVIASLPPRLRSLKSLPRENRACWRASVTAPDAPALREGRKRDLLARIASMGIAEEDALLPADQPARTAERSALRALAKAGWIEPATRAPGARFVPGHPLNPVSPPSWRGSPQRWASTAPSFCMA